ncbi:tandem-95 repeat protein [Thalassospira marina]|nr:Ig-like domain-containing protein [Thalassospira marina]
MAHRFFSSRLISELEPRVMFDGAGAIVADTVLGDADSTAVDQHVQDTQDATAASDAFNSQGAQLATGSPVDGASVDSAADAGTTDASAALDSASISDIAITDLGGVDASVALTPREVVIYDPAIDGLDDLLSQLDGNTLVFALDSGEDALSQIARIMSEVGSVSGLHIVSHGDDGAIELGGKTITTETLLGSSDVLASWQTSMTADADILLYGCEVGDGVAGQAFLHTFSALTGADVAASDDVTGLAALGGDWDLEVHVGAIETSVLAPLSGYQGVLTTAMSAASTNFAEVLKGASFDPGQDTQATAAVDLVGDASNAMLYIKYDDNGTTGTTSDDEIYFRLRTDHSADKSQGFSGYAWMGMDVDGDGDLDAFLMAFGTSQGFSINVYSAGTGANNSPSTTSLDSQNPVAIVTKEAVSVDATGSVLNHSSSASSYFGRVADIDSGANGNIDNDGDTDYFLTFKVNADNFFSKVNTLKVTGGGGALISSINGNTGINKDTNLRFVVATAQQANSLNGDMGGINDGTADKTATYSSLGMFVTGSLGNPETLSTGTGTGTAPTITVGDLSFTEGNSATQIDTGASASDSNGDTDWDTNSKMEVQLTSNAENTDQLAIATNGNFTISGGNLSHNGTVIGTVSETSGTANDGIVTGSDKLTINFNSNATNAIVQELARSITFFNSSENPLALARIATFTLTDKGGLTGSDTSTISVTPVNDAPTASNNTVTTAEDTPKVFAAADFNFSDVDGNSLASVQITTLETKGSLQYNSGGTWVDVTLNQIITKADIDAGKLRFSPLANDSGTSYTSFDFKVSDGTVYSVSAYTMTVDVTPVNDAPTAANNTVTTNEDTAKVFTASEFNFADVDGDSLAKIQITTLETNGTLQYQSGGNWIDVTLNQEISKADIDLGNLRFMPAANANGSSYDSFGFKVSDGSVYSSSAYTMTVDVTAVNDAPTAANNTVTTNEDTAKVFTASEFNFADVDGDSLAKIQITTLETNGTLQYQLGGNWIDVTLNQEISKADIDLGNLRFMPAANANGSSYDSFGFKVSDGSVYSSSAYTMTVDVTAVNDAPTAANNTVTTNEDTAKVFTASEFNFADVDGDSLAKIQITTLETNGTLQYQSGGNWIDVTLNQEISKADIDNGNLRFMPAANANGTGYDSFEFKVSDGTDYSASAYTMTVDVTPVNDVPAGADNTVTTAINTPKVFASSDITFNDVESTDYSKIQITALETSGTLQYFNGTSWVDVTLNQEFTKADIDNGNLRFVPANNASGPGYDSFEFKVSDGTAYSSNPYTMTIDVTGSIAPTISVADLSFTEGDGATAIDGSATASDSDGDSDWDASAKLEVQLTANAQSSDSLSIATNGNFSISGSNLLYNSTIIGTIEENSGTANDGVVSAGDKLTINFTSNATNAIVQELTRSITFNNSSENPDTSARTATFTLTDKTGSSGSDTATITVAAVNDAPTAANNTVTTNEDTAKVFAASEFNFTDVDNDPLAKVQITTLETKGSLQYFNGTSWVDVTLNQEISKADIDNGNLRFTPAANANGSSYDSFGFKVSDGNAYSSSAYTMTVDVTAVNDAPAAANNTVTTNEDTAKVFAASEFNFTDVDNDPLAKVQITTLETKGSLQYFNGTSWVDVTLNQEISKADIDNGNLRFTPAANANGSSYDSFGFKVSDGSVYSTSAYTMTVDVTPVNDAPTAANNTVTTNEDTAKVFAASEFNFADVDNDPLAKVQITTLETKGSLQYFNGTSWVDVTLNQEISKADIDNGNLRFTPAANANGSSYDSFGFKVSDGNAYSSSAYTMTVDVTAVNDAPTAANNTVTTNEDTAKVFTAGEFNFADVDNDPLAKVQITTLETKGSLQYFNGTSWGDVTLNQEISKADIDNGNLRFTPAANANGSSYDSFGFKVSDGSVYSSSAYTMTVDVTAVNDAPTAANNTVTTNEDTAKVFTAGEFNFADVDNDPLAKVQITTLETKGSLQYFNGTSWGDVTLNQEISKADIDNGNLRFTPAANANGSSYDSFGFKVSDGSVYSTSAYTMTVDVTAVNDAPTAADKTLSTTYEKPVVIQTSDLGYGDTEGSALTKIRITTLEAAGQLQYYNGTSWVDVTLNQEISKADLDAGNLRFSPAQGGSGNAYANFKFQVHDGTDYSATPNTITFNVGPNTAPAVTSNGGGSTATISVPENQTAVTTVTATDTENQNLTYSISGGEDGAKFSINPATGALVFKAAPDYENPTDIGANNTYIVEVSVSDGNGGVTKQLITVNVTDVPETVYIPPVTPTPAPVPTPAPAPAPTPAPAPVIATPPAQTPLTPEPTNQQQGPVNDPTIITTGNGPGFSTVVFTGQGTSQQTVQNIAISVSSVVSTTTTATTSSSTTQGENAQNGQTGPNGPNAQGANGQGNQTGQNATTNAPGERNLAIQSYVISAKDNSGAGRIEVSVEEGLPSWMQIQTDGATGTLILRGERPEGDNSTYQVKVKLKRVDGEEVEVIITVEPVVEEGQGSDANAPKAPDGPGLAPAPGATGGANNAIQPGDQASLDWIEQLLASLDNQDTDGTHVPADAPDLAAKSGFADQMAEIRIARDVWQARLMQG